MPFENQFNPGGALGGFVAGTRDRLATRAANTQDKLQQLQIEKVKSDLAFEQAYGETMKTLELQQKIADIRNKRLVNQILGKTALAKIRQEEATADIKESEALVKGATVGEDIVQERAEAAKAGAEARVALGTEDAEIMQRRAQAGREEVGLGVDIAEAPFAAEARRTTIEAAKEDIRGQRLRNNYLEKFGVMPGTASTDKDDKPKLAASDLNSMRNNIQMTISNFPGWGTGVNKKDVDAITGTAMQLAQRFVEQNGMDPVAAQIEAIDRVLQIYEVDADELRKWREAVGVAHAQQPEKKGVFDRILSIFKGDTKSVAQEGPWAGFTIEREY